MLGLLMTCIRNLYIIKIKIKNKKSYGSKGILVFVRDRGREREI